MRNSPLAIDAYHVQNPSLGAALQWRFAVAHRQASDTAAGPAFQLLFLVLPMVFDPRTSALMVRTQPASGLRKFADKLGTAERGGSDLLLALHRRVIEFRELSLRSYQLASATCLMSLRNDNGTVIPLRETGLPTQQSGTGVLLRASERLGYWMAPLTLHEISRILKVRF